MKSSLIPTVVLAMASFSLASCNEQKEKQHKVRVTHPKVKSVTITEQYFCQIQSQRHLEVRAFDRGYLETVQLKEGQQIKAGDLMFRITPIHYQGKLDADLADARIAQLEFEAAKKRFEDKIATRIEVARNEAKFRKAQAIVKQAEVELNFANVKAPFDGFVGRLKHSLGSLVSKGEVLTTLSDNSQMRVYFNVPEVRYLEYMADRNQHQEFPPVELELSNGGKYPQPGKIGAIEADFSAKTGSIPFRADFPNPDRLLHHGQAGNVLIHRVLNDVLVIPQRATYQTLEKWYVYVVDEKNVARQREIVIQNELEGVFVIKSGLDVDDKIVLEGIRSIRDGDQVEYDDRQSEQVVKS